MKSVNSDVPLRSNANVHHKRNVLRRAFANQTRSNYRNSLRLDAPQKPVNTSREFPGTLDTLQYTRSQITGKKPLRKLNSVQLLERRHVIFEHCERGRSGAGRAGEGGAVYTIRAPWPDQRNFTFGSRKLLDGPEAPRTTATGERGSVFRGVVASECPDSEMRGNRSLPKPLLLVTAREDVHRETGATDGKETT